jgi:hypothetical protein
MADLASHEKALSLLRLHLGPYADNPTRIMLLKSPFREKMQTFFQKLEQVDRGRIQLMLRRERMLAEAKKSDAARVNVLDTMYPGAVVRANGAQFGLHEPLKGPVSLRYSVDGDCVKEGEFSPLETVNKVISKKKGETR